MNNSLFNISREYVDIINEIEMNEGEITPELEERLTLSIKDKEIKVSNYLKLLKTWDSNVELADKEVLRAVEFKNKYLKYIEKIKKYLLQGVLILGDEGKEVTTKTGKKFKSRSIEYGTHKLTAKRSPKVEILDENDIDLKYTKTEITIKDLTAEQAAKISAGLDKGNFTHVKKISPVKSIIKQAFENKEEVNGAEFNEENYSLVIK